MLHEHHHFLYDSSFRPENSPVLLLTCMDLRLLDEIVDFMDQIGLTDKYDHVILAGASLGALGGCSERFTHWKRTFFDHLAAAHQLHDIQEVFILEHRDCGAYRIFLEADGDFNESQHEAEIQCHYKHTQLLRSEIEQWAAERSIFLRVRSFIMELDGRVIKLDPPDDPVN